MFDALVVLRAIRDPDGTVVDFAYEYANEAIMEHLGYEPSELVGSTLLSVAPRVRDLEVFPALVDVIETGEPMDHEVDWWSGSRATGSFELRARRIEERSDERIALTIRNVTERHELESFVARSEAHLRQVIDALPVGVSVVNQDGEGIYINSAGRRVLAVDDPLPGPAAAFPRLYGLLKEFTGEPYPADELALVRAMVTGTPVSVDDIVVDRDGDLVPIEAHATPLFDADGGIAGAVSVFEDVSQRREHEALLARALAELAAVNEQLDEFAAMAAHDLASPSGPSAASRSCCGISTASCSGATPRSGSSSSRPTRSGCGP